MSMMQRIITSVVGLVVFFVVLLTHEAVFFAAIAIIILLALYEMHKALSSGAAVFSVSVVSALILLFGQFWGDVELSLILAIMLYLISSVFLHTKKSFKDVYSSALITFFLTFFFGTLIKLRAEFGAEAVFLAFLLAWVTDSGAYFSGKFFGKHKLIPAVSPKKTVEGALGGIISTVVFTCIYIAVLRFAFDIRTVGGASYLGAGVLAAVASVFAQLGDLVASVVKRDCNVKDFGTILPGHGGIMDRFDSVVFIAPMVFYYFVYFNKWVI